MLLMSLRMPMFRLKVENGNDTVEINVGEGKADREKELEQLEKDNTGINDTLNKKE